MIVIDELNYRYERWYNFYRQVGFSGVLCWFFFRMALISVFVITYFGTSYAISFLPQLILEYVGIAILIACPLYFVVSLISRLRRGEVIQPWETFVVYFCVSFVLSFFFSKVYVDCIYFVAYCYSIRPLLHNNQIPLIYLIQYIIVGFIAANSVRDALYLDKDMLKAYGDLFKPTFNI